MYKKIKLKNGLRFITSKLHSTKAVTLQIVFDVGSRNEKRNISGISHFIEHLMFKGTKKRPRTLSISKELDSIGAEFNAFTSKDYTGYYIKATSKHVEKAFDVLSDILLNSKFAKEEVKREKGVILEELKMYEDNPLMHIEDIFERLVFGDRPLGWYIVGTKKSIKGWNRNRVLNYYRKNYVAKNAVLAATGDINEKKVRSLAKKYFGGFSNTKKPKLDKVGVNQKSPKINILHKNTNQSQVGIGFPGYSYTHKNLIVLQLMSIILGGNMSSRLFIAVRERRGLAYFVRSLVNPYMDTGTFLVQSGLNKEAIFGALKVILDEFKLIREKPVAEEELKKAKEYLKGSLVLELEDSEKVADWLIRQDLKKKKLETLEQKIKGIDQVKVSDILKVARDVIDFKKLNLAIIGPFRDKSKFLKFIKSAS